MGDIGSEAYSLRILDPSLLDRVAELERRNFPNPWSRSLLEAEFGKTISRIFGLFTSGKLIGYLFSQLIVDEFHILSICVDHPHRKQGLGSLLLQHSLNEAERYDATRVWLEVREGNAAARALYEKFGFSEHSVRRAYYSDNGEDAVVLELAL